MDMISRRVFLHGMAAMGGLAGISSLTSPSARAADTSGYKALVCIFFLGGMDHADTVLPYDASEYDTLSSLRSGLLSNYNSRSLSNLLELSPSNPGLTSGRRLALVPEFASLKTLFDSNEAALIGNVGPLLEPTNRSSYANVSVDIPKKLFSHNDQQSTWMSLSAEGERFGWGGKFADIMAASSAPGGEQYHAISVTGNNLFLSGEETRQFTVRNGEAPLLRVMEIQSMLGSDSQGNATRNRLREALGRADYQTASLLARDHAVMRARGLEDNEDYAAAIESSGASFSTPFPGTSLGRQLEAAAQAIAIRNTLQANRQVFFASMGGFDSHSNQRTELPPRQQEIADAVFAFRNAMREMGMWDNVTVFSASDFGRTLIDNGNGTDHGWGGHHFVAGGAVNGGRLYGSFPSMDINTERYTEIRGRLIPTMSVEQYGAALGQWFGLNASELNSVFPRLSLFPDGIPDFL